MAMTTSRRDAQPPALGFQRQARKKRAVAHEHRRLQLVEPGHDRLERQADGEEMPSVVPGGECLAERGRDVRRAGGRHDGDDAGRAGEGRVSAPVPSLEAHVRRIADRPRVPSVHVDTSLARRAAGGDDLELAQQMVPGAAVEVVFAEASGQARVGHDGSRSCPSDRSWSSPADRRWRDQRARRCRDPRAAADATTTVPPPSSAAHAARPSAPLGGERAANRSGRRTREPTARRPPRGRHAARSVRRRCVPRSSTRSAASQPSEG